MTIHALGLPIDAASRGMRDQASLLIILSLCLFRQWFVNLRVRGGEGSISLESPHLEILCPMGAPPFGDLLGCYAPVRDGVAVIVAQPPGSVLSKHETLLLQRQSGSIPLPDTLLPAYLGQHTAGEEQMEGAIK